MWLQKGDQVVLVPERSMPDTITRCLSDGWVEIADPRTRTEATDAQPPTAAVQQEPIPLRRNRNGGRR